MKSIFVFLTSSFLSYLLFYSFYWIIGSQNINSWATITVITVILHEIGHWVVLKMNGIKANIMILFIIAITYPTEEKEIEKIRKMSTNSYCVMLIAGLIMNFLFILVSLLIQKVNLIDSNNIIRIINLNAVLIIANLLPILGSDGDKLIRAIFRNISRKHASIYGLEVMSTFVLLTLIIEIIIGGKFLILFYIFLFFALARNMNEEYYEPNEMNQALMNTQELKIWKSVYIIFLMVSTFIIMALDNPVLFD